MPSPKSLDASFRISNETTIKSNLKVVMNDSLREPFRIAFRLNHNGQPSNKRRLS